MNLGTLLLLVQIGNADPKTIPCFDSVSEVQSGWETITHWTETPGLTEDQITLKSPTEQLGVWIQLTTSRQGSTLIRFSPEQTEVVSFQKSNCSRSIHIEPGPLALKRKNEESFTDADLSKWMKELGARSKVGLLYVWSPHMKLSYGYLNETIAAIKTLENLEMKVILDPNADLSYAKKIAKKFKFDLSYLKKARSVELNHREIQIHFPSYHLLNDKGWLAPPRLGYDHPKRALEVIREVLKK